MSRPICVHCGKPYGKRRTTTETVRWPAAEPMPEYRGNGIVVRVREHGTSLSRSMLDKLRADHHDKLLRNDQWARLQPPDYMRDDYVPDQKTAYRETWDGVSWWGGYDPFCTLRCALDYARQAYARSRQPGLRSVK